MPIWTLMISTMILMTWTKTKGTMKTSMRTISTTMTFEDCEDDEEDETKTPEEPKEKGAFVVVETMMTRRPSTPSGNPKRRVIAAGATADPVKDYLKQIGRVNLLNAEQEVDLSERIEAGLYAQHLLDTECESMDFKRQRELE